MKHNIWLLALLLPFTLVNAQKKADRKTLGNLQASISYLASDGLEGRLTGTKGEQLAATYIAEQMKQAGLSPKGNDGYLQTFPVSESRIIGDKSLLTMNISSLTPGEEFIPLPFSAEKSAKGDVIRDVNEPDNIWLVNVKEFEVQPHAEPIEVYRQYAREAAKASATGVVFYNGTETPDEVKKWLSSSSKPLTIPVVWVNKDVSKTILKAEDLHINIRVAFSATKRTGTNVVGYIDNKAPNTIVIGAHFDHLGHGEDHNSLAPNEKAIFNGADDNASGTAALLELARQLKGSRFSKNNFLFVAFSGEELGLFGSKYFTEHSAIDPATFNYMINMDMIGRLDSSKGLQIGGIGTSPSWSALMQQTAPEGVHLTYDSSGTGPSDHTSFYRKNIPVLFFFTGTHTDYHKPTDDPEKINYDGELRVIKMVYNIVGKTNDMPKLIFTKTRELQTGISSNPRFTVTLGIMPDYTYQKTGVRVDAVSDGKTAQKAGLITNDVIVQLGPVAVSNLEDYMKALSSFKKGDSTTVKIRRGETEKVFNIRF
ncbi:PDZ domain-containing protein [Chitinophaga sp. CF118]|uniref:M20/M25/M40 family metallo-hydrolase n=1 Tax=Chitinophaga sp. CF118 TaxID=1884367 RepID=UPI0008EE237A|nr:M20/M25/M40 family metallo-hydrolase [Chitinophaga sp. CF118]SFD32292.1 PDZ domain-containing protein [Chitinophaga sp. CF118]